MLSEVVLELLVGIVDEELLQGINIKVLHMRSGQSVNIFVEVEQ